MNLRFSRSLVLTWVADKARPMMPLPASDSWASFPSIWGVVWGGSRSDSGTQGGVPSGCVRGPRGLQPSLGAGKLPRGVAAAKLGSVAGTGGRGGGSTGAEHAPPASSLSTPPQGVSHGGDFSPPPWGHWGPGPGRGSLMLFQSLLAWPALQPGCL